MLIIISFVTSILLATSIIVKGHNIEEFFVFPNLAVTINFKNYESAICFEVIISSIFITFSIFKSKNYHELLTHQVSTIKSETLVFQRKKNLFN